MSETGFHLEQPLWLLGLLLIPLVALWLRRTRVQAARAPIQRYADPHLLPYLTGTRELNTAERWGRFWRWALLWALGLIAMAGPRWDYQDLRLFHPGNNLLILLDVSRSMLAEDVSPNRLGRARQEIQDLIVQNREVRLGLIAFATVPQVLAPITEDMTSLLHILPALSADLVSPNLQGSSLTRALMRAEALLAGLPQESARAVLLLSDGDFAEPGLREQVAKLATQGVRLHVLGIGTPEGSTVPAPQGGVIVDPKDPQRRPVRSALNEPLLQELAQAGGGIYRRADLRHGDTQAILKAAAANRLPPEASDVRTRVWNERYWLPLIPLAVLILLQFRALRRSPSPVGYALRTLPLLLAVVLLSPSPPAQADWFKTREQQGYELYSRGDYAAAAQAFSDPYRRGVALYRAGDYQGAERAFAQALDGPFAEDARYNLGNARFKLGDYAGAAESYEAVLAKNPSHEDAAYNLALARAMLARLEEEQFRAQSEQQEKQEEPADRARQTQGEQQGSRQAADQRQVQRSKRQPQEISQQEQAKEQQQAQAQQQTRQQDAQQEQQQSQDSQQQSKQSQQGQQQQQAGQGQQAQGSSSQQQGAEQQAGSQQQGRLDERGEVHQAQRAEGESTEGQAGRTQARVDEHGEVGQTQGLEDRAGRGDQTSRQQQALGDQQTESRDQQEAGVDEPSEGQQVAKQQDRGEQRDEGGQTERRNQGTGGSERQGSRLGERGDQDTQQGSDGAKRQTEAQGSRAGERMTRDKRAGEGQEQPDEDASGQPRDQERMAGTASRPRTTSTPQEGNKGDREDEQGETRQAPAQGRPARPRLESSTAAAVERFDQMGQGMGEDETREGLSPAFQGLRLMPGPGMALLEERLEQIQGDPSLLIRNQFQLEEMRLMRGISGQWLETRPW